MYCVIERYLKSKNKRRLLNSDQTRSVVWITNNTTEYKTGSRAESGSIKDAALSEDVSRMDKTKIKYIPETSHVGRIKDKLREAKLRWFWHILKRKNNSIGRRIIKIPTK